MKPLSNLGVQGSRYSQDPYYLTLSTLIIKGHKGDDLVFVSVLGAHG